MYNNVVLYVQISSSINRVDPLVLSGHAGSVAGVSYSPDNRLLASCSSDFTCRIWNMSQTKEISVSNLADSFSTGLLLSNDQ